MPDAFKSVACVCQKFYTFRPPQRNQYFNRVLQKKKKKEWNFLEPFLERFEKVGVLGVTNQTKNQLRFVNFAAKKLIA